MTRKRTICLLLAAVTLIPLAGCRMNDRTFEKILNDPRNTEQVWTEPTVPSCPAEYVATDAYGGEYSTPEGDKKTDEQFKKYMEMTEKLKAYFEAHPDGKLYAHFSGIRYDYAWQDVTVNLDDIEDPELLQELEDVGISCDYLLEQWPGSKAAGEAAEKQLKEAYAALLAKKDLNDEEKLLLTKYKPEIGAYDMFSGGIPVTLECDTPWYQGKTMYTSMDKDRNLAIQLFYRYIGKYEFIIFGFPV